MSRKIKGPLHQVVLSIIRSWHLGVFTRQLLIVFSDLILCPLSFPPGAFHLDSSTSLRQASSKPWAEYAVAAKVVFLPSPSLSQSFPLNLTHSVSAHLNFAVFSVKAQEQLVLSVEMQGLAKVFIDFVVQLIPQRQARDLEWDKGVWRTCKGQETRDGRLILSLAWLKRAQESVNWKKILFKTVHPNTEEWQK